MPDLVTILFCFTWNLFHMEGAATSKGAALHMGKIHRGKT